MEKKKITIKPKGQATESSASEPKVTIRPKTTSSTEKKVKFRANPADLKKNRRLLLGAGVIFLIPLILVVFWKGSFTTTLVIDHSSPTATQRAIPDEMVVIDYQKYQEEIFVGEEGKALKDVLYDLRIPPQHIKELLRQNRDLLEDQEKFVESQYSVYFSKEKSNNLPYYLRYKPNEIETFTLVLRPPVHIVHEERQLQIDTLYKAGIINKDLFVESILDMGLRHDLIDSLEKIFAWSIDFFRIQRGDRFKLIFEGKYVDGKLVGTGQVFAAYMQSQGRDYYGFFFDEVGAYISQYGRPMKKSFLKTPVSYARITSRFNPNRLHPILNRVVPHNGTDYAAPEGAPIQSVADGVVEKALFESNNGNNIRIKHDRTYSSQYLHMSRFAEGIKEGSRVSQGQVIGYVGQTGLATGPHVCFRFWKNGKQIDHLKEEAGGTTVIKTEQLLVLKPRIDSLIEVLNEIPYLQ